MNIAVFQARGLKEGVASVGCAPGGREGTETARMQLNWNGSESYPDRALGISGASGVFTISTFAFQASSAYRPHGYSSEPLLLIWPMAAYMTHGYSYDYSLLI